MRSLNILLLILILSLSAFAKKKGAPPMSADAPGDRTCMSSKCHAGTELNAGNAEIMIKGLPKVYTAGELYTITLEIAEKNARAFGFQATVADSGGQALGQLKPLSESMSQLLSPENYQSGTNRQYLTHTEKGSRAEKKGLSTTWELQWQAPADSRSPARFFFAFNAADGNGKKTGDHIYTRSVELLPVK